MAEGPEHATYLTVLAFHQLDDQMGFAPRSLTYGDATRRQALAPIVNAGFNPLNCVVVQFATNRH
jgi:hypothetical protein